MPLTGDGTGRGGPFPVGDLAPAGAKAARVFPESPDSGNSSRTTKGTAYCPHNAHDMDFTQVYEGLKKG